jgi:putative oxidoreductase
MGAGAMLSPPSTSHGGIVLRWITFDWLDPHREIGPLFVRLAVGWHLVYGTQDNVRSAERMLEFQHFLAQQGFAYPAFMAPLSAYAQFVCGILFVVGLFTRPAAAVMVINFVVALWMVHRGRPYPENALAVLMLCGSLFLLFHGPGRWAVDGLWRSRSRVR